MRVDHLGQPFVTLSVGMQAILFGIPEIRHIGVAKRHQPGFGIKVDNRHAPDITDLLDAVDIGVKIRSALVRPIFRRLNVRRRALEECAVDRRHDDYLRLRITRAQPLHRDIGRAPSRRPG